MRLSREKDPILLESRVESLVLAANDDAIQLKADVVSLGWAPACKACMEAKTSFVTADDMHMPFKPMSSGRVNLLNKDTVACRRVSGALEGK